MSALDTTADAQLVQRADRISTQLNSLLDRTDNLGGKLDGLLEHAASLAGQLDSIILGEDKLAGQLDGIEELLRIIATNTEPHGVVFPSSTSQKLENSRVVASGLTQLYGFSGVNTNASAQFILVFDSNSIPANGAVPDVVLRAPASDNFWLSWAPAWRDFSTGVVICNSSTSSTLTIGAADCWFDAQYLALPAA